MTEPETFKGTITWIDGSTMDFEVLGYRLGDPPDWFQLVYPDRVEFHQMGQVKRLIVYRDDLVETDGPLHPSTDQG